MSSNEAELVLCTNQEKEDLVRDVILCDYDTGKDLAEVSLLHAKDTRSGPHRGYHAYIGIFRDNTAKGVVMDDVDSIDQLTNMIDDLVADVRKSRMPMNGFQDLQMADSQLDTLLDDIDIDAIEMAVPGSYDNLPQQDDWSIPLTQQHVNTATSPQPTTFLDKPSPQMPSYADLYHASAAQAASIDVSREAAASMLPVPHSSKRRRLQEAAVQQQAASSDVAHDGCGSWRSTRSRRASRRPVSLGDYFVQIV